jgi:hypothetical protein
MSKFKPGRGTELSLEGEAVNAPATRWEVTGPPIPDDLRKVLAAFVPPDAEITGVFVYPGDGTLAVGYAVDGHRYEVDVSILSFAKDNIALSRARRARGQGG